MEESMGTQRRSAPSRPKAKKAARTGGTTKKPTLKGRAAKPAPHASARKKAVAAPKPAPKPAARPVAARGAVAPPAKGAVAPPAKGAVAPPAKGAVAPPAKGAVAPPAKGRTAGVPAGKKPKLKTVQRPPAPVHPIGVLPPEAISRAVHKPARPIPMSARPAAKAVRPSETDAGSQPVTAGDFQEFEQRLRGERVRVLKEMGHYESTVLKVNPRDSAGDLSGYSFHMADVGTDAMEREKAFQLASAEGRLLLELNEALRRIARGEYGICESCGNPILRARLEAMPTARLCLSCKEKEERAARGGL